MLSNHLNFVRGGAIFLLLALASCQMSISRLDDPSPAVTEISFNANVSTKAEAVTSLSSFHVSAVTYGTDSELEAWTNVEFTGNNTEGFHGDKWWPAENPFYRFYASNQELNYSPSGAIVAASNETDVVCAYSAEPVYKTRNILTFDHIFARIGEVNVTAATGYTISDVSITITPKVSGNYNLKAGAGFVDGTGWSDVKEAAAPITIANSLGVNENDIYLVPGKYSISASWTADYADYHNNEVAELDVDLFAGHVNAISISLSTGDFREPSEIVQGYILNDWNYRSVQVYSKKVPTFGGLEIAPGPLFYNEAGAYEIKEHWNYDSYGKVWGKAAGSTYFSRIEMGQLFVKEDFSSQDGDIDNILDPFRGWRLPTKTEWEKITYAELREGAIVNGIPGSRFAAIELTGVTFANDSTPMGLLIFPDGEIISGKPLDGVNNTTCTAGVSVSELNVYLEQGCAFIPAAGYYSDSYKQWQWGGQRCAYLQSLSPVLNFDIKNGFETSLDTRYTEYDHARLVREL